MATRKFIRMIASNSAAKGVVNRGISASPGRLGGQVLGQHCKRVMRALGLRARAATSVAMQTTSNWEIRIMTRSLFSWLRPSYCRNLGRRADRRRPFVPRLLVLEDRTLPSTFMVSNLADSGAGSLRQAVLDANANHDTDQIVFAPSLQGTIALSSGELNITEDNLTITGPGARRLAVSGSDHSRVFSVAAGVTAEIDGLTITHGMAGNGGGINNAGGLSLVGCTVSDNQALGAPGSPARGGGVYNTGT